jgi:hypothetical protein
VAFRVLADGTVETDSVEEAMKVRAAFLKEARRQGTSDRNISDDDEFSEDTKRFLFVLSLGGCHTSDEIANEAKISKKSIPPLIRGLNNWANRRGLNLDDLLVRTQKSVKGKPVSTYEMTDEFAEKLVPILGKKRHVPPLPQGLVDLPDLREFIRGRRAAIYGFLAQGASLQMKGDSIIITPRNATYVRYLMDNRAVIADLAKEHYGRPIRVEFCQIAPPFEALDDSAPKDGDDVPR